MLLEQVTAAGQQYPGKQVGRADHDAPPDHVEQPAQQHRPAEIAQSERQDVPAYLGRRHVVEVGQHQGIGEEDRVVEKGLGGQQCQPDQCPPPVHHEEALEHLAQWRVIACAQAQGRALQRGNGDAALVVMALDGGDDAFGLFRLIVNHQPAWAFRYPQAHQQDQQTEYRADAETQPPAQFAAQHRRVEQNYCAHRTQRCTDPERAVDGQVDPAAIARRGEFLDGRIDGGVLTADAGPGEQAKQQKAPQVPGERRGSRCADVQHQRDEEQLAPPQAVG
ncbi:hypothetical protein D3C79_627040 [compost metagenome]